MNNNGRLFSGAHLHCQPPEQRVEEVRLAALIRLSARERDPGRGEQGAGMGARFAGRAGYHAAHGACP